MRLFLLGLAFGIGLGATAALAQPTDIGDHAISITWADGSRTWLSCFHVSSSSGAAPFQAAAQAGYPIVLSIASGYLGDNPVSFNACQDVPELELPRKRGHLNIGADEPLVRSPHAQIPTAVAARVSRGSG